MFFRTARKPDRSFHELEKRASQVHAHLRDHWATCSKCRGAAAASAALWCEKGLELMERRIAEHVHWTVCGRCRQAQHEVDNGRCGRARALEHEYRSLSQQLA